MKKTGLVKYLENFIEIQLSVWKLFNTVIFFLHVTFCWGKIDIFLIPLAKYQMDEIKYRDL